MEHEVKVLDPKLWEIVRN